eukprot:881886_1
MISEEFTFVTTGQVVSTVLVEDQTDISSIKDCLVGLIQWSKMCTYVLQTEIDVLVNNVEERNFQFWQKFCERHRKQCYLSKVTINRLNQSYIIDESTLSE